MAGVLDEWLDRFGGDVWVVVLVAILATRIVAVAVLVRITKGGVSSTCRIPQPFPGCQEGLLNRLEALGLSQNAGGTCIKDS